MTAIAEFDTPYAARDRQSRNRALVRGWLYVVLLVMFALFLVGGATRLTDSGLSITEWKPIHGVIPPLKDAEWQEEFAKYQQIPEYQQIHADMTLGEFKTIFWWEWAHRILARGVGALFALPLLFFWVTGRLERGLLPKLVGLLLLGGLQGAVGWWMVASGLVERTDVSQYRLATHLLLACLIFTATMVVARGLAPHSEAPADRATQRFAGLLLILVLLQIYLGGLVAGLDAGLSYNTWPLMDGSVVPGDLFVIDPAWRNFFENPKTVQFVHRCGAYLLFVLALWHMIATRCAPARHHPCAPRAGAVRAGADPGGDRHQHAGHAGAAASGADAPGLRADRAGLCRRALARHQGQLSVADADRSCEVRWLRLSLPLVGRVARRAGWGSSSFWTDQGRRTASPPPPASLRSAPSPQGGGQAGRAHSANHTPLRTAVSPPPPTARAVHRRRCHPPRAMPPTGSHRRWRGRGSSGHPGRAFAQTVRP